MTKEEAIKITGSDLGHVSKMPGFTFGLDARACHTGAKLARIEGSVCHGCYALRGFYRMRGVREAQARRMKGLRHPRWVEAMVTLIAARRGHDESEWFRWHDSGDLQGVWHLDKIVAVARALPAVNFWLPTREYQMVKAWAAKHGEFPPNLTVRLSAHLVDGPLPWALAAQVGATVSGVHKDKPPSGIACDAWDRGHKCGPCRLCWQRDVPSVSYPAY